MKAAILFLLCAFVPGGAQQPMATPPRDTPLVEMQPGENPVAGISEKGRIALAIAPERWRHASTPHFIIHFRRLTEARKVAREIEFTRVVVEQALHAVPAKASRRSHVYVFENTGEWRSFAQMVGLAEWTGSVAVGEELFLNVRSQGGNSSFDSLTLAHEATHAVAARIHPGRRWPLWLAEGFAEYMAGVTVATRKNRRIEALQERLPRADMTIDEMESMKDYPPVRADVARLYQSSERLVRFLMDEHPPERFPALIRLLLQGQSLDRAMPVIHHDRYPTARDFRKAYAKFDGR